MMGRSLHITGGDSAGDLLKQAGVNGDILVWHDVLYDGPRMPGVPDEESLRQRAIFLSIMTDRGLAEEVTLGTLHSQYDKLRGCCDYDEITLWFDGCLFDQSMLVHILTCLHTFGIERVGLICVNAFDGIVPFNGLGQLNAEQMASLTDLRRPITDSQFEFASTADKAFASRDVELLQELARMDNAPLPFVPAACNRLLLEQPDKTTGLGRLESLIVEVVAGGCTNPLEIFKSVAERETPPQYWGDATLWAKINSLAERSPPLLKIEGPASRLPQWQSPFDLNSFRITPVASAEQQESGVK